MENATKALLIAAAVLIVILLIAFGMKIFNSTGDTAKSATQAGHTIGEQSIQATQSIAGSLDAINEGLSGKETVESFNSKFLSYQGENDKDNTVKLITNIYNINKQSEHTIITALYYYYNGSLHSKTVPILNTELNFNWLISSLNENKNYNVTLQYDDGDYINKIIIREK